MSFSYLISLPGSVSGQGPSAAAAHPNIHANASQALSAAAGVAGARMAARAASAFRAAQEEDEDDDGELTSSEYTMHSAPHAGDLIG